MKRQQSGFTLVEIAIVLVIIGLLLGGILKGQELVNSAKAKSLTNDFRNTPIYVYGYQDKYRALPGDDGTANTRFPGPPAAAAGNGDGRLTGEPLAAVAAEEATMFWQHVRFAGLAPGDTTIAVGLPTNAEGGRVGITGQKPISDASFNGSYYICSQGIKGKFARLIDQSMDDGKTSAGAVRVTAAASVAAPTASIAETVANFDDTSYDVCMAF